MIGNFENMLLNGWAVVVVFLNEYHRPTTIGLTYTSWVIRTETATHLRVRITLAVWNLANTQRHIFDFILNASLVDTITFALRRIFHLRSKLVVKT